MILTDDNFASIVARRRGGTRASTPTSAVRRYIFTSNAPEAVPFILFAVSGGRIPLALPVMEILAIDLGTDLVPALALGAEPPSPASWTGRRARRQRSPRDPRRCSSRSLLYLGSIQSLAVMAVVLPRCTGRTATPGSGSTCPTTGRLYHQADGMALAAVVFTQIGNLFAQRTERVSDPRRSGGAASRQPPRLGGHRHRARPRRCCIVYVPVCSTIFGHGPVRRRLAGSASSPWSRRCSSPTSCARRSCDGATHRPDPSDRPVDPVRAGRWRCMMDSS